MTDWIPLRWPAEWKDPKLLELVKPTPINCLTGDAPPPFPLGDLPFYKLDSAELPPGVTVVDGVWPAVRAAEQSATDADAGPTGGPWVDANGWILQLARARRPRGQFWIDYTAGGELNVIRPRDHVLPVAEAEAYGGHWIISPDPHLQQALASGQDEALAAWKKIAGTIRFFQQKRQWRSWRTVAALAVICDFEGDNEFMGEEFLNLASRRPLAYRIIRKEEALDADLSGLKAVLFIDTASPDGKLREKLWEFAHQGGMLILPSHKTDSQPAETRMSHHIFPAGKGSIAAPVEEWYDPYVLAERVHLLISHREDVVRLWNAGSLSFHYLEALNRGEAVVHLINYSRGKSLNAVTLGLREGCRSARFVTPEGVKEIQPVSVRQGIELPLPAFTDYAAVAIVR